jgi:hypothetical protein
MLASGCALNGLAFAQDERVHIQSPASEATVDLPFDVRWTAEHFDGKFLVLFDRSPMRPGQTLLSLVPHNDPCRSRPRCPDAQWLADHSLFLTADTHVHVDDLAEERTNKRAKDRHQLTIVLLDRQGRRVGESAFIREFTVARED